MLYFELKNVRVFRENAIFQAIPNKVQTKNKELYINKNPFKEIKFKL